MVAANRALASQAGLIDDPFAAPLVRAVGIDVYTRLVNGEIPVGDEHEFDPARMGRGMAVRTRFYDNFFLDATRSGIRQVVIVAAGLDARAYRLPWPDGTTVFELDQPAVIAAKAETLAGDEPRCRRVAIGADLTTDWTDTLRSNGFDPELPAAWLMEGLLQYLDEGAVHT